MEISNSVRITPMLYNIGLKNVSKPLLYKQNLGNLSPLVKDTVSFGCHDFLNMKYDDMLEVLSASLHFDKNLLGTGGEAEVHKIDNSNYCIRIPFDWDIKKMIYEKSLPELKFDLSEQDKINHIVAKYGEDIASAPVIMKYINGLENFWCTDKDYEKAVSIMPQRAYDNLFNQICYARNHDMVFDPCYRNVILNPQEKTMTAIDFYKPVAEIEYKNNILRKMHMALSIDGEIEHNISKKVASKILLSAIKDFSPKQTLKLKPDEYKFSQFLLYLNNLNVIEDYDNFRFLDHQFKNLMELKCRELGGKKVKDELQGTLYVIKNAIRQFI